MAGVWKRWVLVPILALAAAGAAPAQLTVALDGVPPRLVYPLPDGVNPIVTAEIGGGVAKAVWLAVAAGDERRIELTPSGEGRFQINLADARVWLLLRDAAERGQFAIHALGVDGATVSSVPLSYSFFRAHDAGPRWVLRLDRRSISGPAHRRYEWVNAMQVERLEWYFSRTEEPGPADAVAGEESRSLVLDAARRTGSVNLDDALRTAWQASGELNLLTDAGKLFTFRARPGALDLPSGSERFEVWQRRSAPVPGSSSYLTVALGDITQGQVILTLRTGDGEALVRRRSVSAGETIAFQLGDTDYELGIDRLVNVLIGEDHAEVTVAPRGSWDGLRIERFLEWLPTIDVVFVRNGKDHDSAAAAEHLRRKYENAKGRIDTFEQFIEVIASRSSSSGESYLVRLADGRTVDAGPWLRRRFEGRGPVGRR